MLIFIINIVAIVITCVFRFNKIGRLAALSETSSKYDGKPFDINETHPVMIISVLSDERTYESDGTLITWLFCLQVIYIITSAIATFY